MRLVVEDLFEVHFFWIGRRAWYGQVVLIVRELRVLSGGHALFLQSDSSFPHDGRIGEADLTTIGVLMQSGYGSLHH